VTLWLIDLLEISRPIQKCLAVLENGSGEFPTHFECNFSIFPTRFECNSTSLQLVSSVVFREWQTDWDGRHPTKNLRDKLKNDENVKSSCKTSSSLFSSVFFHLFHSFGVYFLIFSTRLECIFSSFPLVWSVVLDTPIIRHIWLIRHGQYNLDSKEHELTALGRF
jgi:hypothetical protein